MKTKHFTRTTALGASTIVSAVIVSLGLFGAQSALTKAKYDFPHLEGYQKGIEAGKSANKLILLDFYFDT